ncbi:MAG: ribosomal-processing cysteine protease Prp [Clostridia bacterium]|nr:ribosomal-processing cysteine protease Prp [Clostridia bacterium]
MTKVIFFKTNGVFYGFEEQGHAGYAEEGHDIVCAAVSAMTMLIINAIEVGYASDVDYSIDEKTTNVRVIARGALPGVEADEKKQFAVSGLIQAYYYQLNDMLEEYYDYLDVEVQELHL